MNIKCDPTLQKFANTLKKRVRKDWDLVIAISGEEGVGKSTLAIDLGFMVDEQFDLDPNIAYLPDHKDVKKRFFALKQFQVFNIDEAIKVLYKMKMFDRFQQMLTEMFATERFQNKVTILCIPRFMDLTENFRKHRVKIWIHVIARGIAIAYIRDDDKDTEDPWHNKDNLKIKKRLLAKPIYARTVSDKLEYERKTKNYYFDFVFPDLSHDVKRRYLELKRQYRKVNLVTEDMQTSQKIEKYKIVLKRTLLYLKSIDPEFNVRKYAEILGFHYTYIASLLRSAEEEKEDMKQGLSKEANAGDIPAKEDTIQE